MVPGGLEVISYTTRFTPFTLLIISLEHLFKMSCGIIGKIVLNPSKVHKIIASHSSEVKYGRNIGRISFAIFPGKPSQNKISVSLLLYISENIELFQ